eukprot:PITA_19389
MPPPSSSPSPSPSSSSPSRPSSPPIAPAPELTVIMNSLEALLETLKGSIMAKTKEELQPLTTNSAGPNNFEFKRSKDDISRELQKIKLPEFSGGRAGERAEAWLEGMNRCFKLREYSSFAKTKIVVFQLKESALIWWGNLEKQLHLTTDNVPWELFKERFRAKYLPPYFQQQQATTFHTLVQGNKTVEEYEIRFMELVKYIHYLDFDEHSFISSYALNKCELATRRQNDFRQVEMASGDLQSINLSVDQCKIDLGVCSTKLKVYVTALGIYDLVIGMDWLEAHQAWVDSYGKGILGINDEGEAIQIQGIKRKVSLRYTSTMKMKRCLRKGCQEYVNQEVSKEKGPSLEQYLVLAEFLDVFPKELPGLPPERELDLTIELKLDTQPISKTPYRITALELQELQIQLKELLDMEHIRPSISPWGAPVNFVKKKDGSLRLCIDIET